MLNNKQTSAKKHAFSFVELAIAIVVIGVLVAGVMLGSDMIDKSKLATARNLTKNSPVEGVESLFAWYETTSDSSILPSENNKGSSLSIWKDIKVGNIAIDAVQSNGTYKPEFSGKINGLTTTSFDGTGKNFAVDATNLNNIDYTIIVVEKRNSGSSNNYFIGDSSITSDNENILLGYSSSGQVIHSQGGTNSYDSSVSAYSDSSGVTRIFTFIQKKSSGKETYINGYLAGQDSDTNSVNNLSNLIIGKDYNGEIGEIIIYNKALSSKDRRNVEEYLGKKWAVEVSGLASSPCTNGIITGSGCEIACSVNVNGVVTPTSVNAGTSGNLNCNDTGYNSSDIVAYDCSSVGSFSITSGICDTCDSGYSYYGGICQAGCDPSIIDGVASTTNVNAGTGSVTCDDTANHFDGTSTVSYVCDAGTITPDSGQVCGCASGYDLNSGGTACVPGCTGGTIDTSVSGYKIHKFLASGTFQCPTSKNVEVLVVAGGGAGYAEGGFAGGGGGVIYNSSLAISTSPITVTVGAGGTSGSKGQNSVFSSITAYGGGGAMSTGPFGSGNGYAYTETSGRVSGTAGQGNSGGIGCNLSNYKGGGGGGGAGQAGSDANCSTFIAGKGGDGVQNSITGVSTYYGGGGGADIQLQVSPFTQIYGDGGAGGGGNGNSSNGTANTGGGGGVTHGNGGSGIVIVRYTNP